MVSSFFLSRVLRCRWCCGVLLFCVCFAGEGRGEGMIIEVVLMHYFTLKKWWSVVGIRF